MCVPVFPGIFVGVSFVVGVSVCVTACLCVLEAQGIKRKTIKLAFIEPEKREIILQGRDKTFYLCHARCPACPVNENNLTADLFLSFPFFEFFSVFYSIFSRCQPVLSSFSLSTLALYLSFCLSFSCPLSLFIDLPNTYVSHAPFWTPCDITNKYRLVLK